MGEPITPDEKTQEQTMALAHVIWEAIDNDEDIEHAVKRTLSDYSPNQIEQALYMLAGTLLLTAGEIDEDG